MQRGVVVGFAAGVGVAAAVAAAFVFGRSVGNPASSAAAPPPTLSSTEAPSSTRAAPTLQTASPTDNDIKAVNMAPPADSCLAYPPGHGPSGNSRIYLRGVLLVKAPQGAVVTYLMH